MKIVHLTKEPCGGAARYAELLDFSLRESGYDSSLVTGIDIPGQNSISSVPRFLNRLLSRLLRSIQLDFFHTFLLFWEYDLRPTLRDADIIHIHSITNWISYYQIIRQAPQGAAIIFTLHDLWPVTGGCVVFNGCDQFLFSCGSCPILRPPFSRFLARFQLFIRSKLYSSRPIWFIANSEWTHDKVCRSKALSRCVPPVIIHPAIETHIFHPADDSRILGLRTFYSIPHDKFVIIAGCSSLTDNNKNVSATVRVVSAANRQLGNRLHLVLFGDGKICVPSDLSSTFVGSIQSKETLAELYQLSDLFVSTSCMETYGITLIEAMASGVPVVAFSTGAIPSVLDNGRAGYLTPLHDEQSLIQLILRLFMSPAERSALASVALDLVQRRNHISVFLRQHLDVYYRSLQVS